MSSPVSFGAMVTSVTQRANLENQIFTGGFISPVEVRGYLNEGLTELWEKLVAARGQEHMRKTQAIVTTPGTSAYPMASDCFEVLSVDINLSPGNLVNPQLFSAVPYMESERNWFNFFPGLTGWYWGSPVFYRILGVDPARGQQRHPEKRQLQAHTTGRILAGRQLLPELHPLRDGWQPRRVCVRRRLWLGRVRRLVRGRALQGETEGGRLLCVQSGCAVRAAHCRTRGPE